MTRRVLLAVLITASVLTTSWADDVYCRYSLQDGIHYGQVKGNTVYELDRAPWDHGRETGHLVPLDRVHLLHPSEPQKIIGLSGAYSDVWEPGQEPPSTVRWFLKPPSSAASPGEDVQLPAALDEVLVETELVIVIGRTVRNAGEEEAKEAIFGYTVGNDIVGSVDSYHRVQGEPLDQEESLLPPGLKMGDRFAPFGPFIHQQVDWRNRERTLSVINSETGKELLYNHNTSNLVYTPEKIVGDLSRVFTLSPGDVIFTGTTEALPAQAGDVTTVAVEGLGSLVNRITLPK